MRTRQGWRKGRAMPENSMTSETRAPEQQRLPMTGRLIFGLTVIGLGVLFLLDELGQIDASAVLRWWPAVLLAFGLMKLTRGGQNLVSGGIMTLIGSWLLLRAMGVLPFGLRDFWPIVLIAIGGLMVGGGMRRGRMGPAAKNSASTVSGF